MKGILSRLFILLSIVALGKLDAHAQHPTWQLWEVIDSIDVPEGEIDTLVLNRHVRLLQRTYPDLEVRYVYNLKFNTERPEYGTGELIFDWPLEPDSSYLRTWFDTQANLRISGTDSSWRFSGRLTTPPGEFAIFQGYFSNRVPAEFVFNGAPIIYTGRSYKPGVYAEYGFFVQEIHPIWHPPIVSSSNEVVALKGTYPNPFHDQLSIPWDQRMGNHFTVLLYGIDGKLAWSEQVTHTGPSIELQLDALPLGQYNLVVAPPLQKPMVAKVLKVK